MGAPAELIAATTPAFLSKEGFAVLPDNWDAVRLFLAADSQWRYAGAVPIALDYSGVEAAARLAGLLPLHPETFHNLKTLEAAAVSALMRRLR